MSSYTDPFFDIGKDSEWNACIGRQGSTLNYTEGYMEAAIELVNAVITQRLHGKRDTLAMPILYNARHALELSLKHIHDALCSEGIITNPHPVNHKIQSYWKFLSLITIGDQELRVNIRDLGPYVLSLNSIDEDGQELRYAENKDGQKSLGDKSLCNLEVIKDSLLKLQEILSKVIYRLETFQDERKTETYTSGLSRNDLENISKQLPNFDDWKGEGFKTAKEKIKQEYGIGSNKFSAAINLIQKHRTFASSIGKEFTLLHLTDEEIKRVIQQWRTLHPPKKSNNLGTDFFNRNFDAMFEYSQKKEEVQENVSKILSKDQLADLEAVFYIGRENMYCEFYEEKLASVKKEHESNNNTAQEVSLLMEKVNFLNGIAKGLKILGKSSLACELQANS